MSMPGTLGVTISDLVGVEPRSIGSDLQAAEAACWVEMEKNTEAAVEEWLGPLIKYAYTEHKRLIGEKKSLLEKLWCAKDRVRVGLANWIATGHAVQGCYIKTVYHGVIIDPEKLPDEYSYRAITEKKLDEWAQQTEGQQPIPGCSIDPVHVLYSRENEKSN